MNHAYLLLRRHQLVTLLAIILFPRAGLPATPLTLDDYFQAALQRSEIIANQVELIHQAEEHYQQANSALLPTVNGVASYTRQDPLPASSPQTPGNLSNQTVTKLTATQPLFRGMREYAALRQSQVLVTAQNQDYQQARTQLYKDVVQSFYAILAFESDIANYEEEVRLNQQREKDIRDRVRIGRSRLSELLNVQSNISTLRAQIELSRGQLRVAREAFAFQSGLPADTSLRDSEAIPEKLEPLPDYLAKLSTRPDIQGIGQRLSAADEGISIARGGHLPTLDLTGNYYFERPGYLDESKWDVQLTLTVPLYAGGSVQSKVREAESQRQQVLLQQSQVSRQADQEIRSLYQSVSSDIAQHDALENATADAKKSYEAQLREYRLGLVTNLDVLQALTSYQQNQRALGRATYVVKSDYLRLQAAAARRPTNPEGSKP